MQKLTNPGGDAAPPGQVDRPAPNQRGDRVLRRREALAKAGIGKTLMYDLLESEAFPKPRALGGRRIGWLESEIDAWIVNRELASRKPRQNKIAND